MSYKVVATFAVKEHSEEMVLNHVFEDEHYAISTVESLKQGFIQRSDPSYVGPMAMVLGKTCVNMNSVIAMHVDCYEIED